MGIKEIQLSSDGLSFTALEAGSGTPVFLLHGFPDTPHTWKAQIPVLADAGYRVIAPTSRGYEVSSQPANRDYSQLTLGRDVLNWMANLGIEKAHLIGHDWGSCVAQTAALLAPEKFHSLTIMAVPHVSRFTENARRTPKQLRNSWYMAFFQLRGIAEQAVKRNNFALIDRLWKNWSPSLPTTPEQLTDVKHTLSQPGVTAAALSYYRQGLNILSPEFKNHQRLFRHPFQVAVMAISGKEDGCIDHALFLKSMRETDFANGIRIEEIDTAGHFMNQERPEEVNSLLLDWLTINASHTLPKLVEVQQ